MLNLERVNGWEEFMMAKFLSYYPTLLPVRDNLLASDYVPTLSNALTLLNLHGPTLSLCLLEVRAPLVVVVMELMPLRVTTLASTLAIPIMPLRSVG
ncbi:hypothetical protein PHJA_002466600 [Phtheirospermum japonicum]|uniref:Uncharacterized protein n=1 Tax=Phtheirospermum japonicum TaxID=374723 RepID=A0A830CRN9_9LAMI|nr:hypothetical protein PHJA_002466600 [Phtheirospermum japonicum]